MESLPFGDFWTNSCTISYENNEDHCLGTCLTKGLPQNQWFHHRVKSGRLLLIVSNFSEWVGIYKNKLKQTKNTATQRTDSLPPAFVHHTNKGNTKPLDAAYNCLTTAGACSDCEDPTLQATILEELNYFK